MRLKNLELQGYKTFALRTGFVFDGGITAIIGPNGSGKSNIADAIRWVLGEQSYRTLRGKRTEDMIFSGSAQRARLGMAYASLTLDNADGWLPIDFAEVTVTRRAYRSGENEYLLNGSRVRLRDINELLASSGLGRRGYTVIGQGLVDAVLSLRPEDRRALFEEAAGIALYQAKRAEALARLEETRANLVRVSDIINEIAPRLRRLERDSEKAERHALLSQQLQGLLRVWYGFRWRQGQLELQRSRDALGRRETIVNRRRTFLDELEEGMAALRVRQSQLREQLGAWHRESSDLHGQMEEVLRDLAVWQERQRLLSGRSDELRLEQVEQDSLLRATVERVSAAQQELEQAQGELAQQETQVSSAQAELDAHEEQRAGIQQKASELQAQAIELSTAASNRRNRLEQIDERRRVLGRERGDHQSAIEAHEVKASEIVAHSKAVEEEQAQQRAVEEALDADSARLESEMAGLREHQAALRASLSEAQGKADRLQDRLELLTRLRAEGEGLRAGVRAVLRAGGRGGSAKAKAASPALTGVLGTVAQLVHVPAEYEVAIEVALGGHLQDVVVETWDAASTAIGYLKKGNRGRVTFLPLDTVRPVRRLDLPRRSGVIGVAADLVKAQPRLEPVVEMLLGRTVIAQNLSGARSTFDQLRGGFQIVTLNGEVLRSSGSVTGGRGRKQAQGQVLAREREWRELPARVEAAQGHRQEIESSLSRAQNDEQGLREQITALAAQQRKLEQSAAQLEAHRRDLVRNGEHVNEQMVWRQGLIAQLDGEATELDASESALQAELAQLESQKESAEGQIVALETELQALQGDALYERLSEARTAVAVARGTRDHRRSTVNSLAERQAELQTGIGDKEERIAALESERLSLADQIAGQASRETVIQGWLASLTVKIEPAESELGHLEAERERREEEEATLRTRLRDAESRHGQALVTLSRYEDRLHRLREQITDDFGLVDMELTEGLPEQPPLPLGEMVSALPSVQALPPGLEQEMQGLKAQLRRMGSVNPRAPEEYGEVLDRHTFLTTQTADLEEAAEGLREVISELDEVMSRDFQATFKQVAGYFRQNFAKLFGGGTARLILTNPEDISRAGVEIVAQPPGRRQQTLALLSGGERSLTAVALVFALLEVSAPPFCILDEVDAMLDEANVRRFRSSLEKLAEQTQFVIITHNRRTIEAADTIYGVSMGDDSVSQVVSLRLEGDRIAAPDGTEVDVAKEA